MTPIFILRLSITAARHTLSGFDCIDHIAKQKAK